MGETSPTRKSKLRTEDSNIQKDVSPTPLNPPQATAPPATPITAVQDEFTSQVQGLVQELLLKAHELSFEYSTLECEEINICPLARKSKELFRTVKKLNELVKQFKPTETSSYVS